MSNTNAVTASDVNATADGVRHYVNVTDDDHHDASAAMDVDASEPPAGEIDEGLYSRQLYVMGHDAQLRMGASSVLVVGLNGLGVEIAKNIVLAGVKSVVLYDNTPASYLDLAAQFYLTEANIGEPRARVSAPKLAELNPYVHVTHYDGELSETYLQQFRVVVVVNARLAEAKRLNAICHANNIAFVSTEARGVFGSVFCDVGESFTVADKDGEPPVTCMVASISNATSPAVVTVSDDARHQLETGDVVTFREISGFGFLNDCAPRRVTVTGPFTFTLDVIDEADAAQFAAGSASTGGYVTQVKQPVTIRNKPLDAALAAPGDFLISDFAKIERPALLHVAFQALDAFMTAHSNQLPTPGSQADATEVYRLAVELNAAAKTAGTFALDDLETDAAAKRVILAFAAGAVGVIAPMAAFLGGIVAQEALKACSAKFTPIQQFLYFDALECLPDAVFDFGSPNEFALTNSRYDAQIAVFGTTLQSKLQQLTLFLVGAGAIGCEMLKNWAMMGIATSESKGKIVVTDMDTIEKSNLNRQFLFRSTDVQQPKASVAARAIAAMNPNVRVEAFVARVGSETEDQFTDDFFESLDGVCTALDNVDARLYMDQRCLFYGLPMFESGTLGTKGNTQVVVPHVTENYGASRDPPEKSIPICTLKNFPNAIEHTLQWARDWFEGAFFQAPSDVNQFISNNDFVKHLNDQQNTKLETLERLHQSLVLERPATFDACVTWARFQFEELFSNQLKQLLHNFPRDQLTTTGAPFWSGPKRPPTPLAFDVHDTVHVDFVVAVATSRAQMYGLVMGQSDSDRARIVQLLTTIDVPAFAPRDGVKIAASDAEMKDNGAMPRTDNPDAQADHILNTLPTREALGAFRMAPIEFDKDNDAHMAVIVATSNLRARSYVIPEADLHKSRFIAGKIIPAIATTTALVTGLVCFELLKVFQQKPLEAYKNGFVNLALPLFTFSEPIAPKPTETTLRGEPYRWTAWDRLDVTTGDMTLREFLAYFEKTYDAEISMLSYGVTILYAMYSQKSRSPERMAMKISDLVATVTKKPIDPKLKYLILEVCAMDADGEDVELPYLRYHYRQ